MDTKQRKTKIEQTHNPTMGVTINCESTTEPPTALEWTASQANGGSLNAFYWIQIFALILLLLKHEHC